MGRPRIAAGAIVEGGIYSLLFFLPLCYGGVQGWARGVIQIVAGAIVLARLVERRDEARPGAGSSRRALAVGVPAGLFVALVVFQLVPLPPSLLGVMAPGSHRLYTATVPGYAEGEPLDAAELPSWLLDRPRSRALLEDEGVETEARPPELEVSPFGERFSSWRTASIFPHETGRRLSLLLSCLAVLAVAAGHFRTRERIRRLAGAMVISALAAAALVVLDGLGWLAGEGLLGPFVNRNTYAAFVGGVLPVAIGMALASFNERQTERGFLWSLASVLLSGALFASLSRAGILSTAAALMALALLVVYYERRAVTVATLGVLLAASVLFLVWLGPEQVLERIATVSEGSSEPSLAHRIDVWKRSLGVVGDYPGVGAGLGTFAYAFMPHAPPEETWWRTAHNEYLELVCDTGLIGGLLAAATLAIYLTVVVRPRRASGRGERFILIGMAPGLLSLAIHSSVSANLQVPAVGMLAAVLAGVLLALALREQPDPASPGGGPGARGVLLRTAVVALIAVVGLNTLWGIAVVAGFFHRDAGETALARAEMDRALESLGASAYWQPGDARTYELIARTVELSLSGNMPLSVPGGPGPDDLLGFGLGSIAAGLDRNPGNSRTWFALATLYQGRRTQRELTRAITAATSSHGDPEPGAMFPEDPVSVGAILQAQQVQPGFTTYHDYMASILMRGGLTEAASDQLRLSFSLRPHLEGHGLIDIDDEGFLQDHGEAILEGIEAAEPDPYTPPVLAARSLGRLLEKMGRLEEAIEAYGKLRRIGGADYNAEFHLAFGRLDQQRGNYLDSIAKLEIAAREGKGTAVGAWAIYHLGMATSRTGHHMTAIKYYRTFLALMPEHLSAHTGLAGELDLVGQIEEAERRYREAVRLFPEEPEAYEKMIAFLERQLRTEEAEQYRHVLRRLAP